MGILIVYGFITLIGDETLINRISYIYNMKHIWHKVELWTDKAIPPALILLLGIIIIEIFYRDIAHEYHSYVFWADMVVVIIFVADLIFKYIRMHNVPKFLRTYWIEILAVFPFYLLFRAVDLFMIVVPVSDAFQSAQMMLHEGLEVEKEGARIVREAGRGSRYSRFTRFLRPVLRLPRFLKISSFYEKPSGNGHRRHVIP